MEIKKKTENAAISKFERGTSKVSIRWQLCVVAQDFHLLQEPRIFPIVRIINVYEKTGIFFFLTFRNVLRN